MINPRHRRSPRNLLINQAFADWDDGGGLFSILAADSTELPWEDVSAAALDIAYHGMRSGEKFCAPIIYNYVDEDTGELTEAGATKIKNALLAMFSQKWSHLWNIYTAEYNPLHTYTLTEEGEDSRTTDTDATNTETKDLLTTNRYEEDTTDSNTRTPNLTDTQNNQVYGFNSSTPVDQSKSTAIHTGTEGNSGSGSVDSVGTTEQDGTDTNVLDKTVDESGSYSKTRTGNLYRSPAELLSFDRDFWLTGYFDIVFADIDKMLTLSVYADGQINYTYI